MNLERKLFLSFFMLLTLLWCLIRFWPFLVTGGSSVLHCTSPLRTILVSLARANERVHVHNEINFTQAKLDSKINVPFLLNEHGDLYFYRMKIVYILSSLI